MDHRPKKFAFLAELFIDFNKSVDDSVVAPAPLSPKRALGHFLFYSKGGEKILCNPNPFYPLILSHQSFSPFCVLLDILCKPKFPDGYFPHLPKTALLALSTSLISSSSSGFSPPNLNLALALLFAIFPNFFLVLLWLDWLFLISSSLTGITDKGKPFERMGRKTTDLSNGRWVTELTSRISPAHSFEVKIGLFFMRNPGGHQEVNHEHPTESCDQAHRA